MDNAKQTLEILAQVSGRAADDLERGQNLVVDLGIDSPKGLQLVMDLEDALGIEISDEAAARLETVGDVLDLVSASA